MLPDVNDDGLLPAGIHQASVGEFLERFAVFSRLDRRFQIAKQIERLIADAKRSGIVRSVLVAGSYVMAEAPLDDLQRLCREINGFVEERKPAG